MKWKTIALLWAVLQNLFGLAALATLIAFAVAILLTSCSSAPPAPLKPCREMPRGYCSYTDSR